MYLSLYLFCSFIENLFVVKYCTRLKSRNTKDALPRNGTNSQMMLYVWLMRYTQIVLCYSYKQKNPNLRARSTCSTWKCTFIEDLEDSNYEEGSIICITNWGPMIDGLCVISKCYWLCFLVSHKFKIITEINSIE